nr:retrotransposon-related protein [Tanacetum cinerariifolium]
MPNTPSINVRPYRHHPNKKEAIELMLKELLKSGVIKTSQSPFSSPIVMVKKKDRSWRIYVNYRKFMKNYASISQPHTALLKKNAFKWSDATELAYNYLKIAMMEEPMLALPNFDQEFVVETDASGTGIEVVLCQNGNPIAYLSKTLATKHQSLSTYTRTQIGFGYTKKV